MSPTPWSQYVTEVADTFVFWKHGRRGEPIIRANVDRSRYLVGLSQSAGENWLTWDGVQGARGSEGMVRLNYEDSWLVPYRVQLPAFRNFGTPHLLLHPLALPHLYAAQQIPVAFTEHLVRKGVGGSRNLELSTTLDVPCELLGMLEVSQMWLTFSTQYDVELV